MAITQTGSTLTFNTATTNTGTVSSTITVPSDAEFVLVGWSGFSSTANFFSGGGMTFTKGGVDTAMVNISGGDALTSAWEGTVFYQVLPDTGANKTLKWDWAGAGTETDPNSICSVIFLKGIDTSSPLRDSKGAQLGSIPYTTATIRAENGDLIIAWVAFAMSIGTNEGSIDTWSNLTLLSQLTHSVNADGAWATTSPTGDIIVAASTGTNAADGSIIAASFKTPAAGRTTYFASASTPADGTATTNTADPTAVTPPASMLLGDLVCMIGQGRAASMTLAISQASGQTWTTHAAVSTTNNTARLFTCTYNGTWGADPSVSFGATTCNSVQMHIFRPYGTNWTWVVNQALVELDISAGSGIHTITGQTTTGVNPTVTLAGWYTADDNTWGTLTSTTNAWTSLPTPQYRNTSGSDMSATYAYTIQTAAGATGNPTQTQLTLGADASTSLIVTMEAVPPIPPDVNMAPYYLQ